MGFAFFAAASRFARATHVCMSGIMHMHDARRREREAPPYLLLFCFGCMSGLDEKPMLLKRGREHKAAYMQKHTSLRDFSRHGAKRFGLVFPRFIVIRLQVTHSSPL